MKKFQTKHWNLGNMCDTEGKGREYDGKRHGAGPSVFVTRFEILWNIETEHLKDKACAFPQILFCFILGRGRWAGLGGMV